MAAIEKTFKKYDTDKDGKLSKKEVQAYSKGEFKFTLKPDVLDSICTVLIHEGAPGVTKENLHRLLAMIGVAREGALDEKRRQAREAREKELVAAKEKLQSKVVAATELTTAASEKVAKLETDTADSKIGKIKELTSADLNSSADEVEASTTVAKDGIKAATDAITELKTAETEAELKTFLAAEVKKLEAAMKPLDARVTKASAVGGKLRSEAVKKNAQEIDKLRVDALAIISHHQGLKDSTNEDMFVLFDTNKDGKIQESEFTKFFSKHKMPAKEGEESTEMSEDSLSRLFGHLDAEDAGFLTKEQFIGLIRKFMKVVKASVITDGKSIKSKILRRLDEGEVVEMITAPSMDEESEVKRMRVKALQDDLDGWVSPVGNAGTVFFEEGGSTFKVVKETILTGAFVIGAPSAQKDKKLKVGEVVEVREWAKKEETSGLMRMQVRVKSDGQIGWATSIGNTGIKFLEMV
jgi:Ca2+-binding EF-hand superfamily protein